MVPWCHTPYPYISYIYRIYTVYTPYIYRRLKPTAIYDPSFHCGSEWSSAPCLARRFNAGITGFILSRGFNPCMVDNMADITAASTTGHTSTPFSFSFYLTPLMLDASASSRLKTPPKVSHSQPQYPLPPHLSSRLFLPSYRASDSFLSSVSFFSVSLYIFIHGLKPGIFVCVLIPALKLFRPDAWHQVINSRRFQPTVPRRCQPPYPYIYIP